MHGFSLVSVLEGKSRALGSNPTFKQADDDVFLVTVQGAIRKLCLGLTER